MTIDHAIMTDNEVADAWVVPGFQDVMLKAESAWDAPGPAAYDFRSESTPE